MFSEVEEKINTEVTEKDELEVPFKKADTKDEEEDGDSSDGRNCKLLGLLCVVSVWMHM